VGIQQKNTKTCEIEFYLLVKIYISLKRKWNREIELACVDEKGRPLDIEKHADSDERLFISDSQYIVFSGKSFSFNDSSHKLQSE
jgi:hypothetical protein